MYRNGDAHEVQPGLLHSSWGRWGGGRSARGLEVVSLVDLADVRDDEHVAREVVMMTVVADDLDQVPTDVDHLGLGVHAASTLVGEEAEASSDRQALEVRQGPIGLDHVHRVAEATCRVQRTDREEPLLARGLGAAVLVSLAAEHVRDRQVADAELEHVAPGSRLADPLARVVGAGRVTYALFVASHHPARRVVRLQAAECAREHARVRVGVGVAVAVAGDLDLLDVVHGTSPVDDGTRNGLVDPHQFIVQEPFFSFVNSRGCGSWTNQFLRALCLFMDITSFQKVRLWPATWPDQAVNHKMVFSSTLLVAYLSQNRQNFAE